VASQQFRVLYSKFRSEIFASESDVVEYLRNQAREYPCRILLPSNLTWKSLDEIFKKLAPPSRLKKSDCLILDFVTVASADFNAICLLSPIVHSLAHAYGLLASTDRISSKAAYIFKKYGPLRVMGSYFLNGKADIVQHQGNLMDGIPMKAFTEAETLAIQDRCLDGFNELLKSRTRWFVEVSNISQTTNQRSIDYVAALIIHFRQIIKELVENVSMHAHGIGYFMMELDPSFEKGLDIYVGDTGVGITKGLSRAYKNLNIRSDAKAVEMVMQLKELKKRRKVLQGTLDSGGRGLERVGAILERFSGRLTVRSGTAMAEFHLAQSRKPAVVHTKLYPIQGTHIHIFIPTNSDNR
jgi:hypothetical protein